MSLSNRVPRSARLASLLASALLAVGCGVALAAYGPARTLRAASVASQRLDAFTRVRAAGADGVRGVSPSALQANGKIAFTSDRSGGQRDIFVMNPDGSGQTNVSNHPAFDGEPAFSPDGAKIVFLSDRDGNDEIYVMNADGTNPTNLTNDANFDYGPAFSPDGGRIVFTSERSGNAEIYAMNSDGSGLVNLTNHPSHDREASFSPDGGKIVFVSTRPGGDGDIYVMNADGTNPTRLTTTGGGDPSFSPDGSKIAFTDASSGISAAVAVMNADGTNKVSLTDNSASDSSPAFSPDGTKIVFKSDRDGNDEVYVMNADGSGPMRLTSDGGEDGSPAWQTLLSCAPPPANGVVWYRAEGDANDSIGTNHGTPQNGATFAPGFVGQAFSFDGVDDFVEVPNSAALTPATTLTIAAWIKAGSGSDSRIVDKMTAGTSNGYLLDVNNGRLRLIVGPAMVFSAQSLPLDTFVHVAGVFDGAMARMYINGELAGGMAGGGGVPTNSEPLRIGIASDGTKPFLGLVDEVDIFNRALSAAEVKDIYDAKNAGKCFTPPAFTISGTVTDPDNNPVGDVLMTLSDGVTTATTSTNDTGSYSFSGLAGDANYTVTPSLANFSFSPASRTYNNLSGDQMEEDFTATPTPGTVQFDAADYTVNEAAGTVTVTVTRAGGSFGAATVNYSTTPGTASAPADYASAGGSVTFADGDAESKTFTVAIANDALDEADETFTLALSIGSGSAVVGAQGTATVQITDDDQPPTLSVGDLTLAEGNSGQSNAVFNITLSAASGQAVTVNFATADGTATAASGDYAAQSGTATLPAGTTSVSVNVPVNGDTAFESDETFFLDLTAPTNAAIADAQGQATITNDDAAPTFSISGRVTDAADGQPLANVSVALTGTQAATTQTDGAGNYSFTGLAAAGSYAVTPSLVNYTFAPPSRTFNNVSANQTGDFVGTLNTHTVSGRVTNSANNQPLAGATVTLSGGQSGQTTTDAQGDYSFAGLPAGGTYTVTPSLANFSFAPPSRTFSNLQANQSGDFVATLNTFTITGRVAEGANNAREGVTVTLSGSQSATATTDASGNYSFANLLAGGTYTVTPSLANYSFAPPSRTFNNLSADQTADFAASLNTHAITGRVADASNNALAGVTVTLSGEQSASTQTDAAGNYSFASLPAGGSYIVTPSLANHSFAPPSRTFSNLSTNQTGDFTGALNTHAITGRVVGGANSALAGVSVTLSGSQSATTQTDAAGNYSFANLPAGGSYAVTPSLANYTFAPASSAFNNLASDQTGDFTATLDTFTITGRVADTINAPLAGVTVSLGGTASRTAQTDAQGNYSFASVPAGGNYTVTPAKDGHAFAPASLALADLTANADANFTARISVSTPAGTNVSITTAAATFTFAQVSNAGMTTVTPADPAAPVVPPQGYSFLPGAPSVDIATTATTSGLITVCLSVPAITDPTVFAGLRLLHGEGGQFIDRTSSSDFASKTICAQTVSLSPFAVAFAQPATITGRATDPNGGALPGVAVTLGGAQSAQATTDAAGNYSFVNLPAGQTYTVTAARTNFTFAPPAHTFERIVGNATGDFTGSGAVTISGRVSSPTVEGATVTLSGTRSAVAEVGPNGEFTFDKLPRGGNYKLKPQGAGLSFTPSEREFANLLGDARADFDATPVANPTPTPPVADDFAGGTRDPQKFAEGTLTQPAGATDPLVTVEQVDGKLVITPRPDFTGQSFNGYVAVAAVDFTNAAASIEVDRIAAGGAQTIFSVGSDDQNFYRFVAQEEVGATPLAASGGKSRGVVAAANTLQQLLLQVRAAGVFNSLSIPYDPAAHKFWRFRHDASASPAPGMYFEASPTGLDGTWAVLRFVPVAGAVGALATEISVGTTTAVSSPGRAVFDNLNLVPDQTVRRAGEYRLSSETMTVSEGAGSFTMRVARSGGPLGESTVELVSEPFDDRPCSTADGRARPRCDFSTTFARL
ncbi:MAG TPA: carboxypeptidase regulatory-like domain-containing protein, partial [Pyrinomonadaceae bacterium]|nr:carboxypeptidase regulatory-like domain-containing protein [Pyrinomonadaceae bacterium]